MNYRHVYHAGNFADVIKHVVLMGLIAGLSKKLTPWCYLDTHAGSGYYDFTSTQALKTKEYQNGIEKIIQADHPPPLVRAYLDCIHAINNELSNTTFSSLQYYPGSPLIVRRLLRPTDRLVACELQQDEYQGLHHLFAGDKQAGIHHMDGFLGLKAFLPPKEHRGLVLIDPPYEQIDEFTHIINALSIALKRWSSGIYAIWYPIKEKAALSPFYRSLKKLSNNVLLVEVNIYPEISHHLTGCGLAIINPPWEFDQLMINSVPWLWKSLAHQSQGNYRVEYL